MNFRRRVWGPGSEGGGFPWPDLSGASPLGSVIRQAGASDQVVQHRMRHANRATTSDIYGWIPDAMDAVTIEALQALWSRERGIPTTTRTERGVVRQLRRTVVALEGLTAEQDPTNASEPKPTTSAPSATS